MILPKQRQVRPDAETLLRAAQGQAETGHDFVENEQARHRAAVMSRRNSR